MQKNQQWKDKVQELFQVCQDELKKTTEIGKKMLSASKTNSNLHEAYEEIGRLVAKAIQNGELKWKNERIDELLKVVENCEDELKTIETEVHNIKFAPGPIDVSVEIKKEEVKVETQEVVEEVKEVKEVKKSTKKKNKTKQ